MKEIILASQSPRRRKLLERIGLKFVVEPSTYEEDMTLDMCPPDLTQFLACEKARNVAKKYSHQEKIVIGSDTIVVIDEVLLGKPGTKEKAVEMLNSLNDKTNEVITGLCVIDCMTGRELNYVSVSKVKFRKMSFDEIIAYVETKEPLDKAGAYAIQGFGSMFVERIEGEFTSIVGLPVPKVVEFLKELGVKVI